MIPLRVLLIEDSEIDAELVLRQLKRSGYDITFTRVVNATQLVGALMEQWDLIIADFNLPGFNAIEALTIVQDSGCDSPFIVVSGAIGEETAVALMKSGAKDYIMKDRLSRLAPVVERELIEAEIRRSQKKAHEDLFESERNLKNSQQVAHVGHWLVDLDTGTETWSEELYRILGLDPEQFHGNLRETWRSEIHPDDRKRVLKESHLNENRYVQNSMEYRIIRPDGSIRYIFSQVGEPRLDPLGREIQHNGVVHDITERKLVELDLMVKMKESQNRASELQAITSVSSRMRIAKSSDELIIIMMQELAKLVNADHATMAQINENSYMVKNIINQGKIISAEKKGKIGKEIQNYIQFGKFGFFEEVPQEILADLPEWAYEGTSFPSSLIVFPVVNQSQTIGLIYLAFMKPIKFNQEQKNLVEAVADMAGNALYRMSATQKLESMVESRERELESIYKVTSSASATLNIHQALQDALDLTLKAVHTACGSIFLLDEPDLELTQIACRDGAADSKGIFSQTEVIEHLNQVVTQRKALVIPNLAMNAEEMKGKTTRKGFSFIGLPMRAQDRVVGVLAVVHKKSEQVLLEEMTLLSFIADHLALVVENSRLYKRAERSAVLEERSRLARELHDSVTQSLYSASLYSSGARRFFSQGKVSEADSYLTQIGELTQQALKDMRLLVYELRSPELKHDGLIGALQNRLDAVERRANIEADIQTDVDETLPELVEENLYRIAMESLNNSLKHSNASKINLSFHKENGKMVFSIQDNGVGFSIDQAMLGGGVGLTTMRERAERIGAKFQILTLPEKGTKVEIRFSINQE